MGMMSDGGGRGEDEHRSRVGAALCPVSGTLAEVAASGVEPTEADMAQARSVFAGASDHSALYACEAGYAAGVARALAGAVGFGDSGAVARCVRELLAYAAASAERSAAILAAPGGAR